MKRNPNDNLIFAKEILERGYALPLRHNTVLLQSLRLDIEECLQDSCLDDHTTQQLFELYRLVQRSLYQLSLHPTYREYTIRGSKKGYGTVKVLSFEGTRTEARSFRKKVKKIGYPFKCYSVTGDY